MGTLPGCPYGNYKKDICKTGKSLKIGLVLDWFWIGVTVNE